MGIRDWLERRRDKKILENTGSGGGGQQVLTSDGKGGTQIQTVGEYSTENYNPQAYQPSSGNVQKEVKNIGSSGGSFQLSRSGGGGGSSSSSYQTPSKIPSISSSSQQQQTQQRQRALTQAQQIQQQQQLEAQRRQQQLQNIYASQQGYDSDLYSRLTKKESRDGVSVGGGGNPPSMDLGQTSTVRTKWIDKPVEVQPTKYYYGTVSDEAPRGFEVQEGEITRRDVIQTGLQVLSLPAEGLDKTLEESKKGWEDIVNTISKRTEKPTEVKVKERRTTEVNPLTGMTVEGSTAIKTGGYTEKTPLGKVPEIITGGARLGAYLVPYVGTGLIASEVAQSGGVIVDPLSTQEEKRKAYIEGGIAAGFLVTGGAIAGARAIKASRTAKEIAALEKAETKFYSIINKEGKSVGTIAEIKAGKRTYYSVSEGSIDDAASAVSGKLIKLQRRGKKLTIQDYEGVGLSKEIPIKKVQRIKGPATVEKSEVGKGFVSEAATATTGGEVKEQLRLFRDFKTKQIPKEKLPGPSRDLITGKITRSEKIPEISLVEAGKPRDILTRSGIVKRADIRTRGIIEESKGFNPQRIEQFKDFQIFKKTRSRELLDEFSKLKERRLRLEGKPGIQKPTIKKSVDDEAVNLISPQVFEKKATQKALEQVSAARQAAIQAEKKSILNSFSKFSSRAGTIQKGLKPALITSFGVSANNVKNAQKDFQGSLARSSFLFGQESLSKTDLKQGQNPFFDGSQDVVPSQDIGQITGQITGTTTDLIGGTEKIDTDIYSPPPRPVPPETTAPKVPRLILPSEKPQLVREQGYNVLVKKGKSYEPINKVPLTKESALSYGARETDMTPSAQFQIKKAQDTVGVVQDTFGRFNKIMAKKGEKMQAKVLDTKDKYYSENKYKFREFKKARGKKKPLPTGRFIEKNKYRIDTAGERRGITEKGIRSNTIFRRRR